MCVASSIEAYGVSAGQRIHPAVRRQGVGLPRAQSRKRGDIAAIGRQLGYLLAADEAADLIGLGLDLQGVRLWIEPAPSPYESLRTQAALPDGEALDRLIRAAQSVRLVEPRG